KSKNGYEIIGTTDDVIPLFKQNRFDELMIAIGYKHMAVRKTMFERFNQIVPFATLIHETAWIDKTAEVKSGCVICAGCFIDARAVITENVIVNLNTTIAHDSAIGKHSFLAPRVAVAGFVNVGENAIIG